MPYDKRRLVAFLTLSRIPLAIAFLTLSLGSAPYAPSLMLGIAVWNELSDASDGSLARGLGVASAAGAILDSGTDQVVRTLEFLGLAHHGAIPIGVLALFVSRDSIVMSLRQLADLEGPPGRLRTRLSGKAKGIGQGLCIVVVCLTIVMRGGPAASFRGTMWTAASIWLAAIATGVSLIDYLLAYLRIARGKRPK